MTDYRHPLLFGTLLEPPVGRPLEVLRLAEVTERADLDLVSLSDHPYWPDRLETLALLAAICAATDRVQVVSNLANLPLRPPTALAHAATTLDLLSGGRFELGIGAGAQQMWDEIVAEGGPRRNAGESIDALDEAIQIIRALWTQDEPVQGWELEEICRAQGTQVTPGDALVGYSGREAWSRAEGRSGTTEQKGGVLRTASMSSPGPTPGMA